MGLLSAAATLLPRITDIVSEFVEDKDKANAIAERISSQAAEILAQSDVNQTSINLQDAKSENLIQYGWRPWFCWGITNFYLLAHLGPYVAAIWDAELAATWNGFQDPTIHLILMGILGLAGVRSFDKARGTNTR